jgi:hypothetical protein
MQMAADTQTGTLFMLTTGEQNALYVYRTFFAGNEKLLSAWSRYTFAATEAKGLIHGIAVFSGFLVMLIERDDGFYIEQMPINREAKDTTMGYIPLIDQRETATGTWAPTTPPTSAPTGIPLGPMRTTPRFASGRASRTRAGA